MFSADTNRAQRILRLLRVAQRHGLSRQKLLDSINLTENQIANPDARVPVVKAIRLWQSIANRLDHPDLGLEVGEDLRLREGGVVAYAMSHSENLLAAVERVVRFAKLLNQRAELSWTDLGDRWRLRAEHQPLIQDFRQPVDEGIAGLMQIFQEVIGRKIVAASLEFSYPKPQDCSAHRRLFGSNLHFGRPAPAITLWHRDTDTSTVEPDPGLTGYLDELAEIHIKELPHTETHAGRVRQAVWPLLSQGPPAIGEVASQLALSRRSLQRRLREEGTSFAEVVDALRQDKARLLLADPNLTIYEIGYLLGYSDPSTFHRAFRRWQGTSPGQFRAD